MTPPVLQHDDLVSSPKPTIYAVVVIHPSLESNQGELIVDKEVTITNAVMVDTDGFDTSGSSRMMITCWDNSD